ncbi:TPA: hypothetical protein ACG3PH_001973 [Clostridioides difficile]
MWYVNNITKWMFSKNKEGFRLTMWYVNDKFYRFVSLVKEECRKKKRKRINNIDKALGYYVVSSALSVKKWYNIGKSYINNVVCKLE